MCATPNLLSKAMLFHVFSMLSMSEPCRSSTSKQTQTKESTKCSPRYRNQKSLNVKFLKLDSNNTSEMLYVLNKCNGLESVEIIHYNNETTDMKELVENPIVGRSSFQRNFTCKMFQIVNCKQVTISTVGGMYGSRELLMNFQIEVSLIGS